MKKDKAHFVAFVGVMFALIFVLFLLEGAISVFLGTTPCILSLPVAVALCVYDDWKKSFIGGTLLGACSCLFCVVFGGAFLPYANPLISILPRVFIGVAAYWACFGLTKLFKNSKNKFLNQVFPKAFAGAVGAITNTTLYLLSVYVWRGWLGEMLGSQVVTAISLLTIIYCLIETVACFILVPVYVKVMQKAGGVKSSGKIADTTEKQQQIV